MLLQRMFRKPVVIGVMCLLLIPGGNAMALGLKALGVKVGMDLARKEATYSGSQFDTARLMVGAHLDMGSIIFPKLHFVPGMDLIIQDNLKIYSLNWDTRYIFASGKKTIGYAGGGIGVHLNRFDVAPPTGGSNPLGLGVPQDNTKVTLNIPLGFQKKLSTGLLWFGELKLVIADDETDSSFRFSVGVTFGSGD